MDCTVYRVTVELATSARPGSSRMRTPGPMTSWTAETLAATYSSIVGGCSAFTYATPRPPPRLTIPCVASPAMASSAVRKLSTS